MADLTVTQLLLEKPLDTQRGLVNGVQNSINKLTDIIKFVLVILLPWPEIFGYLIIVSYVAILAATVLYLIYGCRHWGMDVPGQTPLEKPNQESRT
jgi:iron-regulated transporter 1